MALATLPLFGRGFASKSSSVTTQKLINGYRDAIFDPDKTDNTRLPIYGTPGLTKLYDLGGVIRGAITLTVLGSVYIYAVVGNTFYVVTPAGAIVNGGTISPSNGDLSAPVFFAWNGTQLMFVDGQNGWIFTPGVSALAQIVDVDFPQLTNGQNPATCTWLGGFFIVSIKGKGKWQWSAVNDGTNWDPLAFATAEISPDNILRIEQDNNEIVLFGERTTEFWALSGDANVFRRVGGAGIEWGCVSAQTVTKFTTGQAFLAQNRLGEVQVCVLNGYQAQPVSAGDPEINNALNNRTRAQLAQATAFSYFQDGHAFYQLNFPDASYLYDAMTDSWSGRSSGTFGSRHYGNIRIALSQQPYICDYRNGSIYLLDKTAYTDAGDVQQFEVTSKHIFNAGNYVSVNELALEIEAGDGLVTGQGSDPQIMASWSKDGGRTWGNEIWRTLGATGAYRKRAVWRNLGRSKDWAFKFRISDPIKRTLVGAEVEVES